MDNLFRWFTDHLWEPSIFWPNIGCIRHALFADENVHPMAKTNCSSWFMVLKHQQCDNQLSD